MSGQHTPGRLVVRPHGGNWSASYEGYGATAYMGIVSDTGEVVALATAYSPNPFNEPEGPDENARRLVACWNACDGIDTYALELMTGDLSIKNQITATGKARTKPTHRAVEYRRQRDELLAALEQIERLGREADGNLVDVRAMLGDIARAAIAKVKGGAA